MEIAASGASNMVMDAHIMRREASQLRVVRIVFRAVVEPCSLPLRNGPCQLRNIAGALPLP